MIAVFIIGSSVFILSTLGLKIGIDFTGGSLTEVLYDITPDKSAVEAVLNEMNLGGVSIREAGSEQGKDGYLISTRDLTDNERDSLSEALIELGENGEVTRFTSIGPVIGQELKDKSLWAVGGVMAVIIFYVAFAFAGIGAPVSSWAYGFTTIIVLMHDVLVSTALMSVLGYFYGIEVDILFVMAILAVLGYSVNDTIVVFDRVREKLIQNRTEHRSKRTEPGGIIHEEITYTLTKPYNEIVGSAVSETLARSINTSITTALALLALYFIGGAVTQTFALVLLVGVLAGTYSSIFIASPMMVAYVEYKEKQDLKLKK